MPDRAGDARPALSDMDADATTAWAEAWGLPAYRGRQLKSALARRAIQDVSELTEMPISLRERLAAEFRTRTLRTVTHLRSSVDRAEKVVFALQGGATIESVLIRGWNAGQSARLTVCVSSQAGCPAACTFCATGLSGFVRNLSPSEIVDQVMYFAHDARGRGERISNVVFMGMGEPFLNTPAVRESVRRLTDPQEFGLRERGVTISTVGIVPQIEKFGAWGGQVNLAISLHAPNDTLRSSLVPYNRHFPIAELLAAARSYVRRSRRRVSFEYVLLSGVNDSAELAAELASLVRPFGGLAHVNLIPWNPFREGAFVRGEGPDAQAFSEALRRRGINATVRHSKGLDISAACGQLRESLQRTG